MEGKTDKDILTIWKIPTTISKDLIFEEFHDEHETIRLVLKNSENKFIQITFDNYFSYRKTDESFLLKLWHTTPKEILGNVFYIVENSSYIDFFYEMTLGFYSDLKMRHYGIYTIEECIEVLSPANPIIEELN